MALRVVVFDLDGTLIDSSADLAAAVNAALARVVPGTPPLPHERIRSFIGSGARVLVSRSLAAAGLAVPDERALPPFLEEYRARLLDTTQLYPGVAETLDLLPGRTLAVLTNKPGDMSRAILEGLGVAARFARIWGGGDVEAKKPDPSGLLRLLEETGAAPSAAAIVGDSAIDVRTGRAAGARTVGVTYGFDAESLAAEAPDALISDIRQLPEALARLETGATVIP
jgi:phosphoglycolate phosphatase